MPVSHAILGPALAAALAPGISLEDRFQTALGNAPGAAAAVPRNGMRDILDEYRNAPTFVLVSRRADGILGIDAAVPALRLIWLPTLTVPAPAVDTAVETVLRACAAWLGGSRPTITSWRTQVIRRLYWKTAWCYAAQIWRWAANTAIGLNNIAGDATSALEPVPPGFAAVNLNPYANAVDYTPSAAAVLYRGDNRSPLQMWAANGFQPRNLDTDVYYPWFAGNSMADTISATNQQALAVNASSVGGAMVVGAVPAWLDALVHPAGPMPANYYRGFVYELGNLGAAQSVRVVTEIAGREEVYLAIPRACFTRWWVVRFQDKRTFGPFAFAAGFPAPLVAPQWSGAPRQLA